MLQKSDCEAALKQYETEVKNSHFLRFALIEEKFSSPANQKLSQKWCQTKEKYEKCQKFKGELIEFINCDRTLKQHKEKHCLDNEIFFSKRHKIISKIMKSKDEDSDYKEINKFYFNAENEGLPMENCSDNENDSFSVQEIDKWGSFGTNKSFSLKNSIKEYNSSDIDESNKNDSKSSVVSHKFSEALNKKKSYRGLPYSEINSSRGVKKIKGTLGNCIETLDDLVDHSYRKRKVNKDNKSKTNINPLKPLSKNTKLNGKKMKTNVDLGLEKDGRILKKDMKKNDYNSKLRSSRQKVQRKNSLKINVLQPPKDNFPNAEKEKSLNFIQTIPEVEPNYSKYCVLMKDLSFYIKSSFSKKDNKILYVYPLLNNNTVTSSNNKKLHKNSLSLPQKRKNDGENENSLNTFSSNVRKLPNKRNIKSICKNDYEKHSFCNKSPDRSTSFKINTAKKQKTNEEFLDNRSSANSDSRATVKYKLNTGEFQYSESLFTEDLQKEQIDNEEIQRDLIFKPHNYTRATKDNQEKSQVKIDKKSNTLHQLYENNLSATRFQVDIMKNPSIQQNLQNTKELLTFQVSQNNGTNSLKNVLNNTTGNEENASFYSHAKNQGKQYKHKVCIVEEKDQANSDVTNFNSHRPQDALCESQENKFSADEQTLQSKLIVMNSFPKIKSFLKTSLTTIEEETDPYADETSLENVSKVEIQRKHNRKTNKSNDLTLALKSENSMSGIGKNYNFAREKFTSSTQFDHQNMSASSVFEKKPRCLKLRLESVEPIINSSVIPMKREEYEMSIAVQSKKGRKNCPQNILNGCQNESMKFQMIDSALGDSVSSKKIPTNSSSPENFMPVDFSTTQYTLLSVDDVDLSKEKESFLLERSFSCFEKRMTDLTILE